MGGGIAKRGGGGVGQSADLRAGLARKRGGIFWGGVGWCWDPNAHYENLATENTSWPRMIYDIENIVSICELSRQHQKKQKHETLISDKILKAPQTKIEAVTFLPTITW